MALCAKITPLTSGPALRSPCNFLRRSDRGGRCLRECQSTLRPKALHNWANSEGRQAQVHHAGVEGPGCRAAQDRRATCQRASGRPKARHARDRGGLPFQGAQAGAPIRQVPEDQARREEQSAARGWPAAGG
eukprot:5401859-Lingulodinium_polyedra.AAC.1